VTPAPGGGTSAAQTFSITNPSPTLSTLSPTGTSAGNAAFTLTLTGTNFVSGSSVQWNGAARTTTFVSPTQLTAAIAAADVAAAGTPQVTVVTPAPGGGTSAAQAFTVTNPAPGLIGLIPTGATVGTGPLTLLVNGGGFVSGSTVRWNGAARTTTFLSATQLTAAISAADVAAAGTAQITVATPAPGGGTSGSIGFVVTPASTVNVGLIGYWRFDEGTGTITADASGGGNAGALLNGPTWTTGRLGQALSFDGVGAYVQVGPASILNAYPLTVALWIKTAATTGLTGILSKSVAGSTDGYAVYLSAGNLCASFYRDATNAIDDGSGCPLRTAGFNDNQWHQVIYVVDASGARLYVDGVSRTSLGWTGSPGAPSTTQPLQIGRYPNALPPAFFPGLVDDVRIYGRALSAAEALELYTNFGTVTNTPPVISALAVLGTTASSATISWTTDKPSDTQVDYGPTSAYGSTTSLQPGLVTAHMQTLSGLAANTLYYARVRSRDFAGNLAVSSSTTFRTAADSTPVAAAASVQHATKKKKKKSFFEDIFGFLF